VQMPRRWWCSSPRSCSGVRVAPQLIAVADGSHLWSERYDREMADAFAIQEDRHEASSRSLLSRAQCSRSIRLGQDGAYGGQSHDEGHGLQGRFHQAPRQIKLFGRLR